MTERDVPLLALGTLKYQYPGNATVAITGVVGARTMWTTYAEGCQKETG